MELPEQVTQVAMIVYGVVDGKWEVPTTSR